MMKRSPKLAQRTYSDPKPVRENQRLSVDQCRSQSATSLKHSYSNEDFSKTPQSSPKTSPRTRRCSLQYPTHPTLVINGENDFHGSGSRLGLNRDKGHHDSTSSVNLKKDKKIHRSSTSVIPSKDKLFHGSTSALHKEKKLHGSFSSLLKKDKNYHGSHGSINTLDKDDSHSSKKSHHLWLGRKGSLPSKAKHGHKRFGSHGGSFKGGHLAKLKKEKEKEALEKLKKKTSLNSSFFSSSRYSMMGVLGAVVSKKCSNCCCTIS